MTRFTDLRIGIKLAILVAVFLVGFGLFGLFAFSSLNRVKVNGPFYARIAQNHEVIQDILPPPLYIIESYMNVLAILDAAEEGGDGRIIAPLADKAAELSSAYEKRYALWMRQLPEGELKRTLRESNGRVREFHQARDQRFLPAVKAGSVHKAATILHAELEPVFEAHRALVGQAVLIATDHARLDEEEVARSVNRTVVWLLAICFGTAAVTLLFSLLIARSIAVPLRRVAGVANEIAEGKMDTAPIAGIAGGNEIGALVQAFNTMTAQISGYIGKLRASETKYRIVADNTYDWEFWRNQEGEYVYSSPSCERITGYTPADFVADPSLMLRIVEKDDLPAFEAHHVDTLSGKPYPIFEMEYRIITADGSVRWLSHVCAPVYDEAGNFLGKRGTNRDITKRKKAEAELLKAKEEAEAANKAKSAFISSMSHELRTPLNAIMGYTQILLRDENLNETQRNHLEVLRTSGEHLLTLINGVLDMGKLESERMELEEISFDLPLLLRRVFNIAMINAEQKGLAFTSRDGDAFPTYVRGDQVKLQQVLLSLLDNAVRFTRSGGVTAVTDYRSGLFRCEVADTGIGIAPDKLEAIFEPFTQLVREGQVTEGTGLGLTIARHLVTLMHGKMEVESEPGKGSTFRVEIPLTAVGEGDAALPEAPPAVPIPEISAAKGQYREDEVPPTEMLQELSNLAMLGDMKRIRTWAENVMRSEPGCHRFAGEVRELAATFKSKAITALVKQYLPKKPDA